ncbi:hypothetical protein ACINKY_21540 [Paenibacillus illinoisensis]|uniref:Uncharacterized protein n=2 Tax=Paenibacillus illinoisensis TaxID=59845 RepID=A0ABW8HYL3_9BACL
MKYEKAEKNGVKRYVLALRIRALGWSAKTAIETPTTKKMKHGDWPDRAVANGINKSSYYRRVSEGLTPEEAATTPTKGRVDKNGNAKPSWKEMKGRAAQNNVSYSTYMRRLSAGETPEQAVSRPPMSQSEHMKRNIEAGKIKLIERKTRKDEIS